MNSTDNATQIYCNFTELCTSYKSVHGYLSILVCVFGSVTNILNICVLTTREMRWPTNLILTGLAMADLLVMLDYIPFATHFYLNSSEKNNVSYHSYSWAAYLYFHVLFSQICHFISCSLTVILAVWRYITIRHTQNTRLLQIVTSVPRTILTIFLTCVWCPLTCLPLFITHRIERINSTVDQTSRKILSKSQLGNNYTGAVEVVSTYRIEMTGSFKSVSFILYGVVLKLVPCILLTVLSIILVSALMETKKRRRLLLVNSGVPLVEISGKKTLMQKRNMEKEHQTDRTTIMLLTVLILFLIPEFPQAILALLSTIIGNAFYAQCYHSLGDIMDILALVSSAINFVLYCSMSRQFRSAFREIFWPKLFDRWIPVPQNPPDTNGATTQVTLV